MRSQTRLLGALLVLVAVVAAWSEVGLVQAPAPVLPLVLSGAVPCPPGFAPSAQALLLPDVPPGSLSPAIRDPARFQCVALVAPSRP